MPADPMHALRVEYRRVRHGHHRTVRQLNRAHTAIVRRRIADPDGAGHGLARVAYRSLKPDLND